MRLTEFAVIIAGGAGILALVMAAAWGVQQLRGHSRWVDAFWTFGVGGLAVAAALIPIGPAPGWRPILVALAIGLWSLRLGSHLVARARHAGDDPRYRQLTLEWGDEAPRRMFWFLQSQAAVGVLLIVAVALAAHHPAPELRVQDIAGIVIVLVALTGEAVADAQLRRFRRTAGRDTVCAIGLWRWSRHPNYFFEWLLWCAFPIIAIDLFGAHPWGWLALAAPIIMYWALVHVSGIPPLEAHMVRTRGEAFRDYQQRTRPFLPLPFFRRAPVPAPRQ